MTILGSEIVKTLFNDNEDPIGKIISIGNGKYKVIGTIKEKGAVWGLVATGDVMCHNKCKTILLIPQ